LLLFQNQPLAWEPPEKMKLLMYRFGLLRPGVRGFTGPGNSPREFNEGQLADDILRSYLDEAEGFKCH
jgi:hypothetical protein